MISPAPIRPRATGNRVRVGYYLIELNHHQRFRHFRNCIQCRCYYRPLRSFQICSGCWLRTSERTSVSGSNADRNPCCPDCCSDRAAGRSGRAGWGRWMPTNCSSAKKWAPDRSVRASWPKWRYRSRPHRTAGRRWMRW